MIKSESHLISPIRARSKALLLVCAAAASALLAGCSGSSSNNHAIVRATNTIADEGSMTMVINAGAANGTQDYGQTSGYLYFPSTGTSTAAFILGDAATTQYPNSTTAFTFDVTGTNAYTLVAYGDPTQPTTSIYTPNILVLIDNTDTIPSGTAFIRVVNVAPLAGSVNYTLGSNTAETLNYAKTSAGTVGTLGYTSVPAGPTTLTVTSATTGATLFTQSISASAGNAYTVLIAEPTVATNISGSTGLATTYGPIVLNDR